MQYLRGWRALRQDPQWLGKVGIGSLLVLSTMCIPIVGQIVLLGWFSLALRRAISGQEAPLPRLEFDINYLGKLLNTGFKPFITSFVWSLPMIGVIMSLYCCMGFAASLGARAAGGGGSGMGIVALIVMGVGYLFMMATMIVSSLVRAVAVLRSEVSDDINQGLRVKDVFAMLRMLVKELVLLSLFNSLLMFGFMFVAVFTLYIGVFPGAVVLGVIFTFQGAELYRIYLEKGGEPLPVGPLAVEGGDAPLVAAPGQAPPQQPGYGAQPGYGPPQGGPPGGWGGPPPPAQF
ncbi:MAG: DUF4013 domain-containing protein [Sandaracinaceae bacterium]